MGKDTQETPPRPRRTAKNDVGVTTSHAPEGRASYRNQTRTRLQQDSSKVRQYPLLAPSPFPPLYICKKIRPFLD